MQMHVHILDLEANLRTFFPLKSEEDFKRLNQAARDLVVRDDGFINHAGMFAESALGSQNDFIEEIRDQHVRAVRNACLRLENELLKHHESGSDVAGYESADALVYDVRQAIKKCSGAPDKIVDRYVRHGLNVKTQKEVKWDSYVNIEAFLKNLFHHGYRNYLEYVPDSDITLVAIKQGKGKINQKMFEEKEQTKNFYQAKVKD
jgi:hypothetical protein